MNYSAGKNTEEIHGIHVSLFIFREYISVKKEVFIWETVLRYREIA